LEEAGASAKDIYSEMLMAISIVWIAEKG